MQRRRLPLRILMSPGSTPTSNAGLDMDDLIYLAAGAALFLLMAGYIAALRKA